MSLVCLHASTQALACRKPIILIRETDSRHGAARILSDRPVIRCCASKCGAAAVYGDHENLEPWPTRCDAHKHDGMTPVVLDTDAVGWDALNYALFYGCATPTVDSDALKLAIEVLDSDSVTARLRWYPELEFRTVSVASLLTALGMRCVSEAGEPGEQKPRSRALRRRWWRRRCRARRREGTS